MKKTVQNRTARAGLYRHRSSARPNTAYTKPRNFHSSLHQNDTPENKAEDSYKDEIWYYTDDFERYGPVNGNALIRMYLSNEISDRTLVWKRCQVHDSGWSKFGDCELFEEARRIPVPANEHPPASYSNENNPLRSILMWGVLIFLAANAIIFSWRILNNANSVEALLLSLPQQLFTFYLACYLGLWVTYFRSKSPPYTGEQYPTLRRLLHVYSVQWNGTAMMDDHSNPLPILPERETIYQKKATTGLTALAMLASAALIELVTANVIYIHLLPKEPVAVITLEWSHTLLFLGSICAFSAFVSFLVAADALDSLFNRFKYQSVARKLLQHFYNTAVNPRYYGFFFLITGAAVLMAAHSPLLGSIALALVFIIGYPHWFPARDIVNPAFPSNNMIRLQTRFRLRALITLVPPALLILLF